MVRVIRNHKGTKLGYYKNGEIQLVTAKSKSRSKLHKWLNEGVPVVRGVNKGGVITEELHLEEPESPFFGLALLEHLETLGWTVSDERSVNSKTLTKDNSKMVKQRKVINNASHKINNNPKRFQPSSSKGGHVEPVLQEPGRKFENIIANCTHITYNAGSNCGIGSGGFQPGNKCAKGGRGGSNKGSNVGPGGEIPKGYKATNPNASDSLSRYLRPDGSLTPERKALHDSIVKEILGTATPVKNPEFVMMGGGPASGKSVALHSGKVKIDKNSVTVDSDEIKKSLPEYASMSSAKNPRAAAFSHEESSMIAQRVTKEAAAQSKNVILDGTGNSTLSSVEKKVAIAAKHGAKIKATYVTVDTEVAIQRNKERAEKTGRLVPEQFVRNAHASVSKIVPQAIAQGLFDELEVYDTNNSGQVRLVATAKGKKLTVVDQELWKNFLDKGK